VLLCLLVAPADASNEAPIPVEAFYRHPAIDRAELSPSGARLAVLTGVGASRIGLAVFDLQNNASSKVVARFSDADIRYFRWVNAAYLVFSLIDLPAAGDQLIAPGLFSVKADGSEQRQLVNLRRIVASRRVGREPLDWNHRLLSVPAGGGNDVIV